MKLKEEIDQEEYLKYRDIGIALSNQNKQNKQIQDPFLRRLLWNREQCTEVEQNLYNFIYHNWLWCLPVYKHKPGQGAPDRHILVGYRMLDKESVMKQAFDFG
jgi:hypothetical protein